MSSRNDDQRALRDNDDNYSVSERFTVRRQCRWIIDRRAGTFSEFGRVLRHFRGRRSCKTMMPMGRYGHFIVTSGATFRAIGGDEPGVLEKQWTIEYAARLCRGAREVPRRFLAHSMIGLHWYLANVLNLQRLECNTRVRKTYRRCWKLRRVKTSVDSSCAPRALGDLSWRHPLSNFLIGPGCRWRQNFSAETLHGCRPLPLIHRFRN